MTTTETIPTVRRTCSVCGQEFDALSMLSPFGGRPVFTARACSPCVERVNGERAAREIQMARNRTETARQTLWESICPSEYRTVEEGGLTDWRRLWAEQPKMERVMAHPLGPRGLILRGPTGARKTRCMYRLMRLYFERRPVNPRIVAMTAGEFDRQARDAAGNFTLSAWFRHLAGVDVLFLDDLGKGSWTRATAGQFWELVDDRTKNARPIFATTNYVGDALTRSLNLDGDTAPALLRRLREHCDGMVLQPKEGAR